MPLSRYQIRNEYSLADPELYRAADKDDPEAVLEGVAMAGLVGVLRQLGDLAEFAAEIFHNLHEEVIATAARGHGLVVRVQQLEAEFPSIEKAFLSQTNHSSFYYNAGLNFHPNLRTDQSLITQGDLPRFIMDSYEECRGPPRLFLLDKFDIAGAGACLKRYTDPSFFKVEAASSGLPKVEIQRDKKIRKAKKKGSHWRNGGTPDVLPTSHAKLHQLFLVERVESGSNEPARLVRLKKRQLNGSPRDAQTGKSYMEKILRTPSPEHKVVHEIPFNPPSLQLLSNNTSEIEVLDIRTVSPQEESLTRNRNSFSPIARETVVQSSRGELCEEVIDRGTLKVSAPYPNGEIDEISSTLQRTVEEKQLAVGGERKTDGGVNRYPSDDVASEVENYMDALTTMETELETDTEARPKNDLCYLKIEKHGTDSGVDEEQPEVQDQFSDSQSIGDSSASDNENTLIKKGRSSFSDSDAMSNLAENSISDGDGAAIAQSSVTVNGDASSSQLLMNEEISRTLSHGHILPNGTHNEVLEIPSYSSEFGEPSCSSHLSDINPRLLSSNHGANCMEALSVRPDMDEISSDVFNVDTRLLDTDKNRVHLDDNVPITATVSDVPAQTSDGFFVTLPSKSNTANEFGGGSPDVFSDALLHLSNNLDLASAKNSSDNFVNEVLQAEFEDDGSSENLVNGNMGSPHSIISSAEDQLLDSTSSELKLCSSITLLPESLHASSAKPDAIVSKVDTIQETGVILENSTPLLDTPPIVSFSEQKFSEVIDDSPPLELQSVELGVMYSGEKTDIEGVHGTINYDEIVGEKMELEGVHSTIDCDEIVGSSCNVDGVGSNAGPLDFPNSLGPKDHVDNIETGTVQAEALAVSVAPASGYDDDNGVNHSSPDVICSPSRSSMENMQESLSTFGDSHPKGLEFLESSAPGDLIESHASRDFDSSPCSTVSYNNSILKSPTNVYDSLLYEQTQNTLLGDVTTYSTSSKQIVQDMESTSSSPTHPSENAEIVSNPSYYFSEPEIPPKPTMDLQGEAGPKLSNPLLEETQSPNHMVHENADETSPKLSNLQFEHVQAPNHIDQEHADQISLILSDQFEEIKAPNHIDHEQDETNPKLSSALFERFEVPNHIDQEHAVGTSSKLSCAKSEQTQAPYQADHERCIDASSVSSSDNLPSQPFGSESSPQSAFVKPESSEQPMYPSESMLPSFGMIPQASEVTLEEMPPLPPLPPIQWRMGKLQPAPLATLGSFPPIPPPTADNRAQFGFSALATENPFLQSSSLYLEMPTMVNDGYSQQDLFTRYPDPFLAQPALSEIPQYGFHSSDVERVQHSLSSLSSIPTVEDTTSRHAPENLTVPSESGSDDKKTEHGSQDFEGEMVPHPEAFVHPPTMQDEWPWLGLVMPGGEMAPSGEDGRANGKLSVKVPRPRNPLIDAVAAHDKSKLRKVTERVRSEIGPKEVERDSLLEQIRTKSFNLKPAVAARPSIQGPKTNLKVAAILEKAIAIRQALVGSDDDEDTGSWSE